MAGCTPGAMSSTLNNNSTILVVDDDELILSSLRGLFTLETEYELLSFSDPKEAVKELGRRPIDVVISDFLMPEVNGVELLRRARELQPETARILLTGFADKENAIRAINEAGLYQYIEKPWDNEDLLLHVRNAVEERSLRQQLSAKLEELDELIREHTDLSDRHSYLERELEMAARVQRSLLPREMPQIEGFRCAQYYQPCDALGGDYYDVVQNPRGTIFLITDVTGHGVQAALTSMLIKASFHDAAAHAETPQALLQEMNGRLHRFLPSGMYACGTIVWVPAGEPGLSVSNAGLPYPVVLGSSPKRFDEIPVGGLPLGMFGTEVPIEYDARQLTLDPGDVLLIASDGLGEIRPSGDEQFQDKAQRAAFAELTGRDGHEVIQGLVERAREFNGGDHYDDDITLLAITKT